MCQSSSAPLLPPRHTHETPKAREAGPVYTCSVCSTSTGDTPRNSCDPDVFALRGHWGARGGGRNCKTRERIIPGQRRLTVFGPQSSGRIRLKAGQLWCGTLSQLEADENESFQRMGKKKNHTATIHKFRRSLWLFWLVSMFTSAYRHLTQSTARVRL